jgi:hypothetical protein
VLAGKRHAHAGSLVQNSACRLLGLSLSGFGSFGHIGQVVMRCFVSSLCHVFTTQLLRHLNVQSGFASTVLYEFSAKKVSSFFSLVLPTIVLV